MMSDGSNLFHIPLPELQIDFSTLLLAAADDVLQPALLKTVERADIRVLDEEAHHFVPEEALRKLAARGVRAELAFALPSILTLNPKLLGYYRLLLGFSRKAFYTKKFGLSEQMYSNMEDKGALDERVEKLLPELCAALNNSAAHLVTALPPRHITKQHLKNLTLLTFGPQLRGNHNVAIGTYAIREVFETIKEVAGSYATTVNDQEIVLVDATGRRIQIRFSSDPDIEVLTVSPDPTTPLLAIEVKGGTDLSNAHNRLGEAEKSHLKAKAKGHTDLWPIVNVEGLADTARQVASPTTTAFFDLRDLVARQGAAYEAFRERLLQKLRLPGA